MDYRFENDNRREKKRESWEKGREELKYSISYDVCRNREGREDKGKDTKVFEEL